MVLQHLVKFTGDNVLLNDSKKQMKAQSNDFFLVVFLQRMLEALLLLYS
jgi:hypothetical protein